jgi:selenide,water dikinase
MFLPEDHPDLLVGLGRADDAAVYRLDADRALVATTDFFTPVVDDPWSYGAIAAANALSDVYAMGGRPLFALNIAAFPESLPPEIIAAILRGGAEKVKEAGAVIAGGHTISDKEPKYGLVVIGEVHPDKILTKGGARPGDKLVLTKPLGVGVVTTGIKRGLTTDAEIEAVTRSMLALNRRAAEAASELGLRSATDITGFGLIGHASEMLVPGDGVGFRFDFARLPFLPGTLRMAEDWVYPGGAHNNREYFAASARFTGLEEWQELLCFSPETSGGLLVIVPPADEAAYLAAVEGAVTVGEVVAGEGLEVVHSRA